jgi:hypothetical protein
MFPSKNGNHQQEVVQVREEIERVVNNTAPQLKGAARNDLIERLEGTFHSYSSPYLPPPVLAELERLSPGCAKDIITQSIKTVQHYQDIERAQVEIAKEDQVLAGKIFDAEASGAKEGRGLGFCAYIATLVAAGVFLWMGYPPAAYICLGAATLGIVRQLIASGNVFSNGNSVEATEKKPTTKKKD